MKYQVSAEAWKGLYKPLWLGAALLNSSYSYFWDIERDWEIQFFTSPGALRTLVVSLMVFSVDVRFCTLFWMLIRDALTHSFLSHACSGLALLVFGDTGIRGVMVP